MALAWQNNPNGVCEDAPCCGCCGPQGDGAYDPEERAYEAALERDEHDEYDFFPHDEDDEEDDGGGDWIPGESPDPNWMND